MVKIDYDVIFQPLRLQSPGTAAGKLYAARFTRRGMDYLSHSERCRVAGEVVFATPSDPITQAPCTVVFTEIKERRTVDVEIYDFTNQRRPEKLGSSSFDLIDVCDVAARQKARKRIELRFRIAGRETVLEFLVMMTPAGQTPLERGVSTAGGASPENRRDPSAIARPVPGEPQTVLPADVSAFLIERGLVGIATSPGRDVEVVMDEDVAAEISTRVKQLLARRSDSSTAASAAQLKQRDELLAEVRALETALETGLAASDGSGREMDQILQQELLYWQKIVFQQEAGRDAALAGIQQKVREAAPKATLVGHASTEGLAGGESIVDELEAQQAALQEHLHELEAQQARRDVTTEACEVLEAIAQLSTIIDDAKRAAKQDERSTFGGQQSELLDLLTPNEVQNLSALAQELLTAEAALERNQYALTVAQTVTREPPARDGPAPPGDLKCMSSAPLFTQATPTAGVSNTPTLGASAGSKSNGGAAKDTRDLMSDLFAGFSSSSSAAPDSSSSVSSNQPPASASGAVDNLFAAPAQLVTAEKPPKRVAQFAPPVPTPSALVDVRCAVSPAEIDFGDKSLIGYQVNIINDSNRTLVIEETKVIVEDLFSANEVIVEGILYPRRLEVAANGGSASLCFGAFNQALLICRGTMSLSLRASATASGGIGTASSARVFSIRLPSH
jgi:hypothetical protein